ncbi:MAG TPA: OmpA family protein [Xanthobacteraceae bacterium]|nr:OmpA family protein [Xanthobacteraceae bacterium]
MWVAVTRNVAATLKPAVLLAGLLLAAGCAENKPAPEAKVTGGVEAGTPQDFVLNVGDRVFFAENSAELSQTATTSLDKQAAWLAKFPDYRVTIEGHSDEKGDKRKNKKLSAQRADAVDKYLAEHGVDKSRLHVVSYGRDRRVATCNDISCWSQNRRVVTVLQTGAMPEPRARPPHHAPKPHAPPTAQAAPPAAQARNQMPVFAPPQQTELMPRNSTDASPQRAE